MIRASVEDADRINDWIWRDSGKRLPTLESFLSDRNTAVLIEGEGAALFVWRGPGIYELHLCFEQRGKAAKELLQRMLEWMRAEMGAKLFWAAVPVESRNVVMFARLMGWKSQGLADLSHGTCELFTGE